MRYLTLAMVLAMLAGCQVVIGLKDNQRVVTYTQATSTVDVALKCDRLIANIDGCAKVQGRKCEIVAMEPAGENDKARLLVLGHELWHCFTGDFHGK